MAGEVITVYPGQKAPGSWAASVFIEGFASDPGSSTMSWQSEVIALLRKRWKGDGRLVVFVPEPGSCDQGDVGEFIDWYDRSFGVADVVLFWRHDNPDPRFIPWNLAERNDGQRMMFGTSSDAPQSRHLLEYAESYKVSSAATLADTVSAVLDRIGSGANRIAGECEVPLPVWRTDSFQRWYSAQTHAGNTLLGARQVWTFSTGSHKRFLLYWALHVSMYVRAEDRVKSNEVVISRPDIAVMALYRRGPTIDDTIVMLVREFRSTASTPDGLVHELPSGSTVAEADPIDQAIRETSEETGLAIDVARIRAYGDRQLTATMSAHHAHLFAAEITDEELARLRATRSMPHGVGDTERTWTEITTFGEIRKNRLVDWATLGMIAEAVLDKSALPSK